MLAPALMSGIRRASSLVSPSVARYSAYISQSDTLGRFSPSFMRLHPTSSVANPSLFRVSRRLFGSEAPEHHSRRIYHPCIDGIFQYGFESPTAVTNFLNAALDFKGQREIQNVEHIKRDMPTADPTSPLGYHFTVDVRCRTKDGHHFLVEMQNDFRDDYHLKALTEHSRMLARLDTDQTEDDKEKRKLKNKDHASHFWKGIQGIYTVVITNKAFSQKRMKLSHPNETLMEPLLVNPYELRHAEQLDRHYGDMPHRIVLLMLDHLKKPAAELSSPIEDWAYVFKDTALKSGTTKIPETKDIEDIELVANRNPGIREFIERIDVNNLPAEVRDRHVRAIHYYNTTIVDIEEKGIEKGIEKGKAIGKREGLLQASCAMKKFGIPDDKIAEALGLNQQEMQSLKMPVD